MDEKLFKSKSEMSSLINHLKLKKSLFMEREIQNIQVYLGISKGINKRLENLFDLFF